MPSVISNLNTVGTITVANRPLSTTNLIVLIGINAGAGGKFTFRKMTAGASGYAPSGITFVPKAIKIWCGDASNITFDLCYADNDVGYSSSTAFTNPVRLAGASVTTGFSCIANKSDEFIIDGFSCPASKYLGATGNTATINVIAHLYGYEV
jgi:hypothetical protein